MVGRGSKRPIFRGEFVHFFGGATLPATNKAPETLELEEKKTNISSPSKNDGWKMKFPF